MIEIDVQNVNKQYDKGLKKQIVLKNINLRLTNNKIHFLIGDNGSGKTTFIRCLLNQTNYRGKINISSEKIAYAPEKLLLPDYITINDFLISLQNVKRRKANIDFEKLQYYLQLFKIDKYQDTYLAKLSKGTKQKVNIIQAFCENADIYIFDEPLSGLDFLSKQSFIKEITKLKRQEKLILISTHHLENYHYRNKNIIDLGINND